MSQNEVLSQQSQSDNNEILAELMRLYEDQKDFKRVENIKSINNRIFQTQKLQQDELDAMIIELHKRIGVAEQQAQRPEPAEEHLKRMNYLQRHLDEIKLNVQQLQAEADKLSQSSQSCEQQFAALCKEEMAMAAHYASRITKVKTALSLFKKLAPITFDESKLNVVKGFFTFPDAIVGFDYDMTIQTPHEITNNLWSIIAQRVK